MLNQPTVSTIQLLFPPEDMLIIFIIWYSKKLILFVVSLVPILLHDSSQTPLQLLFDVK